MDIAMAIRQTDSQQPPDHCEPSAAPQAKHTEILRECVRRTLSSYLKDLDGHETHNLYQMVMDEVEPPLIEASIHHTQGNQTRAARLLGISRSTLRKKMAHYGIRREDT